MADAEQRQVTTDNLREMIAGMQGDTAADREVLSDLVGSVERLKGVLSRTSYNISVIGENGAMEDHSFSKDKLFDRIYSGLNNIFIFFSQLENLQQALDGRQEDGVFAPATLVAACKLWHDAIIRFCKRVNKEVSDVQTHGNPELYKESFPVASLLAVGFPSLKRSLGKNDSLEVSILAIASSWLPELLGDPVDGLPDDFYTPVDFYYAGSVSPLRDGCNDVHSHQFVRAEVNGDTKINHNRISALIPFALDGSALMGFVHAVQAGQAGQAGQVGDFHNKHRVTLGLAGWYAKFLEKQIELNPNYKVDQNSQSYQIISGLINVIRSSANGRGSVAKLLQVMNSQEVQSVFGNEGNYASEENFVKALKLAVIKFIEADAKSKTFAAPDLSNLVYEITNIFKVTYDHEVFIKKGWRVICDRVVIWDGTEAESTKPLERVGREHAGCVDDVLRERARIVMKPPEGCLYKADFVKALRDLYCNGAAAGASDDRSEVAGAGGAQGVEHQRNFRGVENNSVAGVANIPGTLHVSPALAAAKTDPRYERLLGNDMKL